MEESGEMTEEKCRERHDWVEASMRTLEMAKLEKMVEGHERREMIGKRRRWEVKIGDRREEVGGWWGGIEGGGSSLLFSSLFFSFLLLSSWWGWVGAAHPSPVPPVPEIDIADFGGGGGRKR